MKISDALKSGFLRSAKAWKASMIVTLALLFLISFFTISVKGVLRSSLGSSAVSWHLTGAINFDVVSDLSGYLKNSLTSLSSGLILIVIAGMILFTFFSGGLFNSLKDDQGKFSVSHFFKSSAEYFWPFLGISLIVSLIIGFVIFSLGGIIVGISMAVDAVPIHGSRITGVISMMILATVLSVFFLVADYARADYSAGESTKVFKSVGNGFKMTFNNFPASVTMMLILITVQIFFMWLMTKLVISWKPSAGPAVFLMLISTQLLFFIRIFLRSWRYASVISMMEKFEKNAVNQSVIKDNEISVNEFNPLI